MPKELNLEIKRVSFSGGTGKPRSFEGRHASVSEEDFFLSLNGNRLLLQSRKTGTIFATFLGPGDVVEYMPEPSTEEEPDTSAVARSRSRKGAGGTEPTTTNDAV